MTLCYLITVAIYFQKLQFAHACNTMPPVCKTLDYKICKFPFIDGSTKYEKCALHSNGKYWCAVNGDSWGYCNMKTCSAHVPETQPSNYCPLPTKTVGKKPNTRVALLPTTHRAPPLVLNPHTWHLFWDQSSQIPLLSYFHKSGEHWVFGQDGQSFPRGSNGFISPAPHVPSEADYSNSCSIRRGHLLSSEFLRTYLTIARSPANCRNAVMEINNLQRNMINIFPQYKSCNEGTTPWTTLETEYLQAAQTCLTNQREFELIHSVEESSSPFQKGIMMADKITVCYRCSNKLTFSGSYTCTKIENLATPTGCTIATPTPGSPTLYKQLTDRWNLLGVNVPNLRNM